MNRLLPVCPPNGGTVSASDLMRRKPQRICATINWQVHQRLQERADLEGRSFSNLVAYLLEKGST
jgi:hypothetical protein